MPRSSTTCRSSEQEITINTNPANTTITTESTTTETTSSSSSSPTTTTITAAAGTDQQQAHDVNSNNCAGATTSAGIATSSNSTTNNIKKEHAATAAAAVPHRKSERRRVARDIFLVFEEQPSRRRGRGAKGRQTRTKRKFGHLKVQHPNKCILREIKTEPKCALNGDNNNSEVPPVILDKTLTTTTAAAAALPAKAATAALVAPTLARSLPATAKIKIETKSCALNATTTKITKTTSSSPATVGVATAAAAVGTAKIPTAAKAASPKISAIKKSNAAANVTATSTPNAITNTFTGIPEATTVTAPVIPPTPKTTPSVNPIFLWVKQDDTRIVEVRCEDYDKRNRIRLTKTTNGWRSMPRTDASSTRIVKFFQSGSPLMKVKREVYDNHQQHHQQQNQLLEHHQHTEEAHMQQEHDLRLQMQHAEVATQQQQQQLELEQEPNELHLTPITPLEEKVLPSWHSTIEEPGPTHTTIVDNVVLVTGTETNSTSTICTSIASLEPQSINVTTSSSLSLLSSTSSSSASSTSSSSTTSSSTAATATPTTASTAHISFDALLDNATTMAASKIKHTPTYQQASRSRSSTPPTSPMELQLCPKTGLFLPKNSMPPGPVAPAVACESDNATEANNVCLLNKQLLVEAEKSELVRNDGEHNSNESLDANTKNLKDLIDDADLLQHCSSDNGSNGAELLDSLVKRSCEESLVQDSAGSTVPTSAAAAAAEALMKDALALNTFCVADLNELAVGKDLPPMMDMHINDAPKCLSFNEAGEIEGLNGELFQAHNFIDTFDKEPNMTAVSSGGDDGGVADADTNATVVVHEAETVAMELETLPTPIALEQSPQEKPQQTKTPPAAISLAMTSTEVSTQPEKLQDDTPKDLSYKKREEVCPPSESRSQCAVTSSSDILKSPGHEPGALHAEVETTSETIKNLILEQFIKLNALNQLPANPTAGPAQLVAAQQAEPMDLGKCHVGAVGVGAHQPSPATTNNARRPNYLETVIIDEDEEEEEPLKKRHCNASSATKSNIKLDKDPDALTQLKMLLSNGQWKVPDPILVPKERLGAVLASPAREIPLLLTTRPELRLPEAFAYPEIIQNPNILVISMAQLKAILENEMSQSKAALANDMHISSDVAVANSKLQCSKDMHKGPTLVNLPPEPRVNVNQKSNTPAATAAAAAAAAAAAVGNKCAVHTPQPPPDSSLDINATTMAMLQQMLWLPYFGQLSQEFFKTFKDPLGLQRKYANQLLPPFYNNSQFGLQHLDELYKHYMKHMSVAGTPKSAATPTPPPSAKLQPTPPPLPPTPTAATVVPPAYGNPHPLELAIFQKLCQPQLPNLLSMNAAAVAAAAAAAASQQCEPQSPTLSKHHAEHAAQRARRNEANGLELLNIPDFNSNFNLHDKSSAAGAAAAITKHTPTEHKKPTTAAAPPTPAATPTSTPNSVTPVTPTEHKPRLTCKSLSNLLDPEVVPTVPLLNMSFDGMRRAQCTKSSAAQAAQAETNTRQLRSHKASVTYNALEQAKHQQHAHAHGHALAQHATHQRKRNMHDMHHQGHGGAAAGANVGTAAASVAGMEAAMRGADAGSVLDANAALWHPLFGSNPKQGYNSPWQWTTVTATGE